MRRTWTIGIAVVAIVVAVVLAWRQIWVCDDALITFRFVRHFAGGHGLVFNLGERVEGFSSFTHVLLLAPLRLLGASLYDASAVIGIVATACEVALIAWLLHRRGAPVVAIALAAGLFATDRIVAVWATGGLEASLAGALVTAALALTLVRPEAIGRTAVVFAAIAATRPEGAGLVAVWLAYLAMQPGRGAKLRRALNVYVPIVVALLAARVIYYGDLVANPYHAKVDGVPTFGFGAGYTLWFLRRIGLWGLPALATVPLVVLAIRAARGASPMSGLRAPLVLALGFVCVQLAAVVAMGGDYMTDFRFFRPVLGPFYIAVGCAAALAWRHRVAAAIALALVVAGHAYRQLAPVPIFDDAPAPADHKRILTIERDQPARFAAALATFAEPTDSMVADWAGYMSYGHDLRSIDAAGLVSKHLSRDFYLRAERGESGLRERLPGHARWPTTELMQRERITFVFPKVSDRPSEDPEVTEAMPQRTRDYPFLHVTVPVGGGQYLRFFTTLDAHAIAARARAKGVRACFRPAFGELTCVDPAR